MAPSFLKPLLPAERAAEIRRKSTVALAGLALMAGFAVAGMDLPYLAEVPGAPGFDDPADGRDGEVEGRAGNELAAEAPVEAAWPEADTVVLDLSSGAAEGVLGGLPISVSKVDSDSPDEVEVGVLPAEEAESAGISGLLLAVAAEGGDVEVTVGYESMAGYYGGSYGTRLGAWDLADCAAGAGGGCAATAESLESSNNGEAQTITFTVDTDAGHSGGGMLEAAHAMIAGGTGAGQAETSTTVTALAAGESSEQGDYAATELSPSSEWTHGGSTGAFNWSYSIEVPTALGGLAPEITLSYSSQSSDGRTARTNNQGSWIGEGFSYEPGYIERSYESCSDDGHEDVDGAGDQCWGWDNASIVLNGASGDLIKDGSTWRISTDSGAKVERLTGAGNGDNDGEYWKVTTADGTQYFFGKHKLPGYESTDATTGSTWTAPVYGDDSGEPCYNATFKDAYCDQAWRWNLDWVVAPSGAAMSYYYAKETNYYARHNDTTVDGDNYTRGGYLKSIQYGLRSADGYAAASAKVVFGVSERCIAYDASINCSSTALTDDTAANWPDVPWDRNCAASTACEATQSSATFWTRKRLTSITTQVWDGAAYQDVDYWKLNHSFVSNGDTTRTLWLDSITRTGKAGSGADVVLPATTLLPVQKENRVDEIGDNIAALIRPRLATVYTDTGGQVDIVYSGADCTPGNTPTPESNERRCYPVIWKPGSYDDDITDWFNKYVVTEVTVSDRTAESLDQVTRYAYSNPAWRKTQFKGIGDKSQITWSDWRGYATVTTTKAPGTTLETKQVTKYYQGMHGDDDGSGTRSVVLTDSIGYQHTDYDELSGKELDVLNYDDGTLVSRVASGYWRYVTATDSHAWGDLTAAYVRPDTIRSENLKADGTYRRTAKDSDYDNAYGLVTSLEDYGDSTTSADNTCTRTEYARNTAANIVDKVKRVETVAVGCDADPNYATQVTSDVRTLYDYGVYGAVPTVGLETGKQELASHTGTTATYVTTATTKYDTYGRVTSAADAAGTPTTTTYTDANGRNTSQTVTNVFGHVNTTTFDTSRHAELTKTDPNGKVTQLVYDALGRVTQVWMPFQDSTAAGALPFRRFSYAISDTAPVAVTSEQLEEDRVTYTKSIEIFDGLLRLRQTQSTGPGGGRLLTDTFHDELGRLTQTYDTYFATGAPSRTLLVVDTGEVNRRTVTEFDDMGRTVATITAQGSDELWRTTTEYWADQVTATAEEGGIATTSFNNAQGQTTELRQYLDRTPTSSYLSTRYTYTLAGDLQTVVDPEGNTWTFSYDQRRRKIQALDPDTGKTTFTYDVLGNLLTTTDARGKTVTTVYDALSRETSTWLGAANSGVQLTKRVWDSIYKGQETGSFSYEDGVTVVSSTTTRNWDYQPIGQRIVVSGTAAGALAGTYSFGTTYYIDGSVSGKSWEAFGGLDAEAVVYKRNIFGQVTSVTGGSNETYAENLYYEPAGLLSSAQYPTSQGTLEQSWIYGENDRLVQTWIQDLDRSGTLANLNYDYDDAGNLLSVVDAANAENLTRQAECYSYDGLRRLTEAWTTAASGMDAAACTGGPDATGVDGAAPYRQSFTFDGAGNRTGLTDHDTTGSGSDRTWTYTYGVETAHALESVTDTARNESTTFTYDETGNTTEVASSTGFAQALTWDEIGQLETIKTTGGSLSSSGAVAGEAVDGTVEAFYDADGNRVMRADAATATLYVSGVEITLLKSAGTVASTRTVDLPGSATRVESAGGAAQVQFVDHHGTGSVAYDCFSGEVTRRYSDPYGNNLATSTTAADGEPVWLGQNGYVGGTVDPTGYTHIGARDYNPTTGRFLSVDPIADWVESQHLNGYAYSNNNPITFRDDTGLFWGEIGDAIGGAADAVVDAGHDAVDWVKDNNEKISEVAGNIGAVASTVALAAGVATAVCPPCGVVTAPIAAVAGGVALAASAVDAAAAAVGGRWADAGWAVAGMIPGGKTFGGVFKRTLEMRAVRGQIDRLGDVWKNSPGLGVFETAAWESQSWGGAIADLNRMTEARRMQFAWDINSTWSQVDFAFMLHADTNAVCGAWEWCSNLGGSGSSNGGGSSSSSSSGSSSYSSGSSGGSSSNGNYYKSSDGKYYVKGGKGLAFV